MGFILQLFETLLAVEVCVVFGKWVRFGNVNHILTPISYIHSACPLELKWNGEDLKAGSLTNCYWNLSVTTNQ